MDYWIVVVDDEPLSLTNAKTLLGKYSMRVSCIRSGRELLKFMQSHTPDLVLLDIMMPDMDGFETYRALRIWEEKENKNPIPIIFLTGEDSKETERRGLKAGASDFIKKPIDEGILIKRIKNAIENNRIIESLTEEAMKDKLTGFLNKTSGTQKVRELCSSVDGALMVFDLDNFKLVNDLFGHDTGDRVLEDFSDVVRFNIRGDDVVSRIGGDEFMAFFPGLTDRESVASLEKRLNKQLMDKADMLMGEGHGIPLGISIGVAIASEDRREYEKLFRFADAALFEVKRNGKHGFEIYDPDMRRPDTKENIENELNRLISIVTERGEARGAMALGQDAFFATYRFAERLIKENGGTLVRILFSLSSDDKDEDLLQQVEALGEMLKDTLYPSDVILPWQQNSYLVVCLRHPGEDADEIIHRITDTWQKSEHARGVHINHAVSIERKEKDERAE